MDSPQADGETGSCRADVDGADLVKCVGAGGGSVTRLLAERIGERGQVLATDLDTTFVVFE